MVSVIVVLLAAALPGASATNEALSMAVSTSASLAGMRRYFVRSDEEHSSAMSSISQRMNASSALHVLERHEQATPVLMQLARRVLRTHMAKQQKTFLQASKMMGTGYGGFKPALDLLNSMLYESMNKYDTEAAKCTDYYSRQCGFLEGVRSEVSASNYKAATCREKTLGAQANVEQLTDGAPEMSQQLKQTDLKCKHEVHDLDKRLKIVLGDIGVLTQILEMTECNEGESMLQASLLHCQSNCKQKKFLTLDHQDLQKHLSSLKSPVALGLVQEGFSALASDSSSDGDSEEAYSEDDESQPTVKMNKTAAPVPRTQVPDSPCDDPDQGAPSSDDKRAAKCTVSGTPQCNKIQERFLLIQSSIMDERDDLKEEIQKTEGKCEDTKGNLEEQLKDAEQDLKDEQTKLADSMTCEANAGEEGRLSNKQHTEATADLKEMMKTCSGNYQNFETEICGLKKIRGELYKMRGSGKPPIFQDCQVSAWEAQECSKPCGGGVQKLTRSVATQPQGGAKCLPLAQMKSCQDMPCPVDCKLEAWAGWSKCSAECGGGVMQRLRDVQRHMKNNGKPCGETSETKACNVQSCESDCELSDWGAWGLCSKDCDSGTRKRQKFVKKQATGSGTCPGMWDTGNGGRLAYTECNRHRCKLAPKAKTLTCKAKLDVVLLIDGSGSLGRKGWMASKKAAEAFVAAFEGDGTEARLSVILFSGPKSWSGVKQCFDQTSKPVDMERVCNIKVVKHFTKDLKRVRSAIKDLQWPKGSTLTSLALGAAASELNMGRKDARSVVAVITDGRPMSFRKTTVAARNIRKAARLLWVPVTRFAPLKRIREWATRRWQENVVPVKTFDDLAQPNVINKMIADICPPRPTFSTTTGTAR